MPDRMPRGSSFVRALALVGVAIVGSVVAWRATREPVRALPALEHPNFVIVVVDSTRADRLDATWRLRPVMPNVRALARRGARFTQAIAQSGWTVHAVSSILTGRYPLSLDATRPNPPLLPKGARTLATVLGYYGYRTGVIWGGGPAEQLDLLSSGFGWRGRRNPMADEGARPYDAWLGSGTGEPFLLFVHELDAHVPGDAFTAANMHTFGDDGQACRPAAYHEIYATLLPRLGASRAREHVFRHYDGVLHGYDALLGQLFARIAERGQMDRTIVIVTSNHGEDILDHGEGVKHGGLYEVDLRVPLVIAGPGVAPGIEVDVPVQQVDLAPTVLALAVVTPDAEADGASLVGLLRGEEAPAERCRANHHTFGPPT